MSVRNNNIELLSLDIKSYTLVFLSLSVWVSQNEDLCQPITGIPIVADHQSQPELSVKVEPHSSISSSANLLSSRKNCSAETDQYISFSSVSKPTSKRMSTISKPMCNPTNTEVASSCTKLEIPPTSLANLDRPITNSIASRRTISDLQKNMPNTNTTENLFPEEWQRIAALLPAQHTQSDTNIGRQKSNLAPRPKKGGSSGCTRTRYEQTRLVMEL